LWGYEKYATISQSFHAQIKSGSNASSKILRKVNIVTMAMIALLPMRAYFAWFGLFWLVCGQM